MLPKMCIIFTVATAALLVGSHSAAARHAFDRLHSLAAHDQRECNRKCAGDAYCNSGFNCNDCCNNNVVYLANHAYPSCDNLFSPGLGILKDTWGLSEPYHWRCCACKKNCAYGDGYLSDNRQTAPDCFAGPFVTGMCMGNANRNTDVDCSANWKNGRTRNKGMSVTGSTVGECCEPPPITGMCTGNTGGTGDVNCAGQFWINGRTRNKGASVAGSTVGACCEAPPITGMCMGNTGGTGDVNCLTEATNTVNKGASVAGSTVGACCEPAPCTGHVGWGSINHYSAHISPCDRNDFISKLKPGEGYYWSTYPNDRTNGRTVLTGGWCRSISPEGVIALRTQLTLSKALYKYGSIAWVHLFGAESEYGRTYFPPTPTTKCVAPKTAYLKAGDEEEAQLPFANVVDADADPTAATTTTNTQPTPAEVARTVFAGIIAACGLYVVWVVARKTPPSNSNKDVLDAPENMAEISEI